MNNFNLHTPTRILFGKGAIAELRDQIPQDARVLVTYGGGSVKKTGVLAQVQDALKGLDVLEFGVCELLGLDALNFANEGKLVIAVERQAAETALAALRAHPLGRDAAMIGEVVERKGVRLAGLYGVKRTLDLPHAEPLPRIC